MSSESEVPTLFNSLVDFAAQRGWHLKYAKWNREVHQSLLAHSLNVASNAFSIYNYLVDKKIVEGSDRLAKKVILAGFFHDSAKESVEFQETYVTNRNAADIVYEDQRKDQIRAVVDVFVNTHHLDKKLVESVVWSISQMGSSQTLPHKFERTSLPVEEGDGLVSKLVHVADVIMSARDLRSAARLAIYTSEPGCFEINGKMVYLEFHEVSPIRGILTQYLHRALEGIYWKAGFQPLAWYFNGTLYMSMKKLNRNVIPDTLPDGIATELNAVLENTHEIMGKTAFGSLTGQVVAKPEFLFASDVSVKSFWNRVFAMNFVKVEFKDLEDLDSKKKALHDRLAENARLNPEEALAILTRVYRNYNLLVVFFGALKQLRERVPDSYDILRSSMIKEFAKSVGLDPKVLESMPDPVNTAGPDERAEWGLHMMKSPLWNNQVKWDSSFRTGVISATQILGKTWRQSEDSIVFISNALVRDVVYPLSQHQILKEAEEIRTVYERGKLGRGTSTCQYCGGRSSTDAIASIFSSSEIYHDHLIAGGGLGGNNKLRVCALCDFEFKLRGLFLPNSKSLALMILPQVALSRDTHEKWAGLVAELEEGGIGKGAPPLRHLNSWSRIVLNDKNGKIRPLLKTNTSDIAGVNERKIAHLEAALKREYDNEVEDAKDAADIDADVNIKSMSELAHNIIQEKARLKANVRESLKYQISQDRLVYNSPNYLLFLTRGTFVKDEPDSSAMVRLILIATLLAKILSASVMVFSEGKEINSLHSVQGYVRLPADITIRNWVNSLSQDGNWIGIAELDKALLKQSVLILIASTLERAGADYGNATLLRLISMIFEKRLYGKVLVRLTQGSKFKGQVFLLHECVRWFDKLQEAG